MKPIKLFLHEEILLLALKDKEGTIANGNWYTLAIGGALLAELIFSGHVKVEEDGKKQFAKLVSQKPMRNKVLDECVEKLAAAKRRATLDTWIQRFSNLSKLKENVATGLCNKKVLRADKDKILWIFTRKIYPEFDSGPEKEIIARLKKSIFTQTKDIDPETAVLVSLAHHTNLLPVVFDKQRLKSRKDRLEKLSSGELVGEATKKAVQAVQAAIMIAAIMPAIMATTISN